MKILTKYLSISCEGKKTPEWFAELNLGGIRYGHLTDLLYQINHIAEILESRGNWLVLPGLLGAGEAEEK